MSVEKSGIKTRRIFDMCSAVVRCNQRINFFGVIQNFGVFYSNRQSLADLNLCSFVIAVRCQCPRIAIQRVHVMKSHNLLFCDTKRFGGSMRVADIVGNQFASRRLRAWAAENKIPIRDCRVGEPKHEIGEEFLRNTTIQEGLFLIFVSRAPAPVWDIHPNRRITRKKPAHYVNHYSFHILDRDWGHITIKISGHPPFPAQVILNGHEYMDRQARKAGILFIRMEIALATSLI